MDNKIPYISPCGLTDITQELAEEYIKTSDYWILKYDKLQNFTLQLEFQLKIQDNEINRINKENNNLRVMHRILWFANICFLVNFVLGYI